MSHSTLRLFLLFCINASVCILADIVIYGHFSRGIMLLDLEMDHQISIYCPLCNRICEHGKNLERRGAVN